MSLLYALLISLVALIISPFLLIAGLLDWRGMRQRLGFLPDGINATGQPVVWFHAASVGEVVGMTVVVKAFIKRHQAYHIIVSTMTTTGLEHARKSIPEVQSFFLIPFDIPIIMRRVIAQIRPKALILLEGELWPSLLNAAQRAGCPVALVNGRMSDRSYPRNKWVTPLFRHMLSRLKIIGVQTPVDAERYMTFGAETKQVVVTGNIKFDKAATNQPRHLRADRRRMLGLSEEHLVIVAGCPRPVEEEEAVLQVCVAVQKQHPGIKFIWAPRHLERLPFVERMLKAQGLTWVYRSALDDHTDSQATVILLDTIGELSSIYAVADIAFVGATLVPLGGHNLLEPAAYGVPVVFGPHTENVRASAGALLLYGGGIEIQDGTELTTVMLRLLENPEERQRVGKAAADAIRSGDGSLERTLALIDDKIFKGHEL